MIISFYLKWKDRNSMNSLNKNKRDIVHVQKYICEWTTKKKIILLLQLWEPLQINLDFFLFYYECSISSKLKLLIIRYCVQLISVFLRLLLRISIYFLDLHL